MSQHWSCSNRAQHRLHCQHSLGNYMRYKESSSSSSSNTGSIFTGIRVDCCKGHGFWGGVKWGLGFSLVNILGGFLGGIMPSVCGYFGGMMPFGGGVMPFGIGGAYSPFSIGGDSFSLSNIFGGGKKSNKECKDNDAEKIADFMERLSEIEDGRTNDDIQQLYKEVKEAKENQDKRHKDANTRSYDNLLKRLEELGAQDDDETAKPERTGSRTGSSAATADRTPVSEGGSSRTQAPAGNGNGSGSDIATNGKGTSSASSKTPAAQTAATQSSAQTAAQKQAEPKGREPVNLSETPDLKDMVEKLENGDINYDKLDETEKQKLVNNFKGLIENLEPAKLSFLATNTKLPAVLQGIAMIKLSEKTCAKVEKEEDDKNNERKYNFTSKTLTFTDEDSLGENIALTKAEDQSGLTKAVIASTKDEQKGYAISEEKYNNGEKNTKFPLYLSIKDKDNNCLYQYKCVKTVNDNGKTYAIYKSPDGKNEYTLAKDNEGNYILVQPKGFGGYGVRDGQYQFGF